MKKRKKLAAWAISYRVPRRITRLRQYCRYGTVAVCPRCGNALDRDYMGYCSCCGQRLSWKKVKEATVVDVPIRM